MADHLDQPIVTEFDLVHRRLLTATATRSKCRLPPHVDRHRPTDDKLENVHRTARTLADLTVCDSVFDDMTDDLLSPPPDVHLKGAFFVTRQRGR
jgi:hypothetical protein